DPTTCTARSAVAEIGADMCPIYFANGGSPGNPIENMPYSCAQAGESALISAGKVEGIDYVFHKNTNNPHPVGTPFASTNPENNRDPALAFLDVKYKEWQNGGGSGDGLKPKPIGLYTLLPAPNGIIGDLTGRPFLTNPSIQGCRTRWRWNVIQPDGNVKSIT